MTMIFVFLIKIVENIGGRLIAQAYIERNFIVVVASIINYCVVCLCAIDEWQLNYSLSRAHCY